MMAVSPRSAVVVVLVVAMFPQTSRSQDVRTAQCCGSCVTGPQGSPGLPGNNGVPGNHGVPGNSGTPGRDGTRGDRGEQGPPGEKGTPAQDGAKGDRGEQGPPGEKGTPAQDGAKGDQGPPGEKGTPSRDGAKGDRGEQGPPGEKGTPSRDGAKGDRGEQGPPGEKGTPSRDGAKGDRGEQGPPGEKGSQGETGSPGTSARRNVKQCVWNNLNDGASDSGKIAECQLNKVSPTTALRLTWNGAIRVTCSSSGCCKRWFFTVNGAECSDPAPIDGMLYINDNSINIHRVSTIDGLCYNLPAGNVTVEFNIGACADPRGNGNAHTGWNSYSRIIVEELDISN